MTGPKSVPDGPLLFCVFIIISTVKDGNFRLWRNALQLGARLDGDGLLARRLAPLNKCRTGGSGAILRRKTTETGDSGVTFRLRRHDVAGHTRTCPAFTRSSHCDCATVTPAAPAARSEERRVGKECRSR